MKYLQHFRKPLITFIIKKHLKIFSGYSIKYKSDVASGYNSSILKQGFTVF